MQPTPARPGRPVASTQPCRAPTHPPSSPWARAARRARQWVIAHGGKSRSGAPTRTCARRPCGCSRSCSISPASAGVWDWPRHSSVPARGIQRRRPGHRRRVGARPRRGPVWRPRVPARPLDGRAAALRAAGHPSVVSVVALAPWCPPAEPVNQLEGRTVVIAHGERDRITDPARSLEFARHAHPVAARLARFELGGTRPHDAPAPADVAVAGPPAHARNARARPSRGPARRRVRAPADQAVRSADDWFPRAIGVLTAAYA